MLWIHFHPSSFVYLVCFVVETSVFGLNHLSQSIHCFLGELGDLAVQILPPISYRLTKISPQILSITPPSASSSTFLNAPPRDILATSPTSSHPSRYSLRDSRCLIKKHLNNSISILNRKLLPSDLPLPSLFSPFFLPTLDLRPLLFFSSP